MIKVFEFKGGRGSQADSNSFLIPGNSFSLSLASKPAIVILLKTMPWTAAATGRLSFHFGPNRDQSSAKNRRLGNYGNTKSTTEFEEENGDMNGKADGVK